VDFLDFDFFHFSMFGKTFDRWPIFNIADAAVTIGVIILIFFYRQNQKDEVITDDNITVENTEVLETANSENEQESDGETDKGKEISL
ncbi:MAG: signal peptidase II, partial [Ignavibacteriaceae bacterium]